MVMSRGWQGGRVLLAALEVVCRAVNSKKGSKRSPCPRKRQEGASKETLTNTIFVVVDTTGSCRAPVALEASFFFYSLRAFLYSPEGTKGAQRQEEAVVW